MKSHQISRIISLPFRHPALLFISLLFSVIIYLTNLQASILEVQNPRWVVSMAVLILLSPLFHGLFILLVHGYKKRETISVQRALTRTLLLYPRLVAAEILVNLAVVAGLFLLVLPGIYLGLRLIFYKQTILINQTPITIGIQESFQYTLGWHTPLSLLLLLAPFYSLSILVGYIAMTFNLGTFGEGLGLITSALTLAWVNTLLTSLYLNLAELRKEPVQDSTAAEKGE